jgi:hypothetical protein
MRIKKGASVCQDIEATCATRACVNWCVGEHERRARNDEGAYVGQKVGRYLDSVRQVFDIWSAAAAAGNEIQSRRRPASTVAKAE